MKGPIKYCEYCGSIQERYYSAKTVATILDCSEKTVRGWINDGTIFSKKAGGLRRIPAKVLEKFITGPPLIE